MFQDGARGRQLSRIMSFPGWVAVVRGSGSEDHSQLSAGGWALGWRALLSSLPPGALQCPGPGPPLPTIWCGGGCRPCSRQEDPPCPASRVRAQDTLPAACFLPRTCLLYKTELSCNVQLVTHISQRAVKGSTDLSGILLSDSCVCTMNSEAEPETFLQVEITELI